MKSIFRKIFSILNVTEKKTFYYLVICNTIVSILDILSLAILVLVIAFYTQGNTKYLFILPATLLDTNSIGLILVFFIFFSLKSIAGYLVFHAQMRFVYRVASRISADNLADYLNGTYSDYVNIQPAAHVRHINDHTIQFAHYVLTGTYQIITELILALITVSCILFFDAKLFFILLLLLLPPVFITGYFTRKKLKNARTHVKETAAEALQYLQESLNGYIEANIYNKKYFFISRFTSRQKKVSRYLSDVHIAHGIPTRLIEVFAILGLVILITVNRISNTGTNSAELINIGAFMAIAYKLIPAIVKISNITAQLRTYEYVMNDVKTNIHEHHIDKTSIEKKIIDIRFDDVSYSHLDAYHIGKINFNIHAGEMVGLSGISGKGKTTLLNLLLGFLEPISGKIFINNIETSLSDRINYRFDIAYVKQQPFLIHDTIIKNVTLAENEYDSTKLQEVLAYTGLQQIINSWPEGVEKIITDNGKNISGGQRQRIVIARALYKNAGLIILDEPFNELDNTSELEMLKLLQQLAKQGKIIFLVTHNAHSLSYCDKVISL